MFENLQHKHDYESYPNTASDFENRTDCPVRETFASILRKKPPANRERRDPQFHEYCMPGNITQE